MRRSVGLSRTLAVELRQRQTNSGRKSAHLNDVLPSVTGDIIVSFDADDVAERSRIRRIAETFRDPASRRSTPRVR